MLELEGQPSLQGNIYLPICTVQCVRYVHTYNVQYSAYLSLNIFSVTYALYVCSYKITDLAFNSPVFNISSPIACLVIYLLFFYLNKIFVPLSFFKPRIVSDLSDFIVFKVSARHLYIIHVSIYCVICLQIFKKKHQLCCGCALQGAHPSLLI